MITFIQQAIAGLVTTGVLGFLYMRMIKREKGLQKEISTLISTIQTLEQEISEFYDTIKVHEHLREAIEERDELLELLPQKKSDLDTLKLNIDKLELEVQKLHEEYIKLLEAEKEFKRMVREAEDELVQ